ncbi:MAG TPA: HTH domain-containing protein [bacterium]
MNTACRMPHVWITTGTLARELGVSRETIWADLERLAIDPVRDSIGRRLLSPAEAERIRKFHARRPHPPLPEAPA